MGENESEPFQFTFNLTERAMVGVGCDRSRVVKSEMSAKYCLIVSRSAFGDGQGSAIDVFQYAARRVSVWTNAYQHRMSESL